MAIKLYNSSKIILDKKFSSSLRGYNALEVDQFLDDILLDYDTIEKNKLISGAEYAKFEKTISELKEKISILETENARLQSTLGGITNTKGVNADNLSLCKRISALERFIHERGFDASKIK